MMMGEYSQTDLDRSHLSCRGAGQCWIPPWFCATRNTKQLDGDHNEVGGAPIPFVRGQPKRI